MTSLSKPGETMFDDLDLEDEASPEQPAMPAARGSGPHPRQARYAPERRTSDVSRDTGEVPSVRPSQVGLLSTQRNRAVGRGPVDFAVDDEREESTRIADVRRITGENAKVVPPLPDFASDGEDGVLGDATRVASLTPVPAPIASVDPLSTGDLAAAVLGPVRQDPGEAAAPEVVSDRRRGSVWFARGSVVLLVGIALWKSQAQAEVFGLLPVGLALVSCLVLLASARIRPFSLSTRLGLVGGSLASSALTFLLPPGDAVLLLSVPLGVVVAVSLSDAWSGRRTAANRP